MTPERLQEIEALILRSKAYTKGAIVRCSDELLAALKQAQAELDDFKKVWSNPEMLHVNLLRHPILSRNQLLHLAGTSENEIEALKTNQKGGDASMFTEPVPMNRPVESSTLIRGEDWDARKEALGLTCLHPSNLLVGTENGWICCECWAEELQADNDRLRKEAEAEKARLDWLESHPEDLPHCSWVNVNLGQCFSFRPEAETLGESVAANRSFRSAIDAAMQPDRKE